MASSLLRSFPALPPAVALALAFAAVATPTGACHSSPAASQGPATCTIALPTPPDWRLVADGTSFRDGLGRVVFLRGVDAGGRSKFAPYVPFDYPDGGYATSLGAYMDHAARWGIDVLRVPFTWAALEPTQGTDDADWLSRYDQLLDAAWARGIWTVVDFHQDVYSEVFCGDGFPGWTVPDAGPNMHDCAGWQLEYYNDPAVASAFDVFWDGGVGGGAGDAGVQSQYVSAWDVMIARYKDKPGVLGFEPINEPGWGTADESTFSATTLTAFYSNMVAHMRAAAPSSLVFIDPTGVDGATVSTDLGEPLNDGGVVFAPHYYPISGDDTLPQAGLAPWATVGSTWNVPVFLGEFGASHTDPTNTAYMSSIFDALDALSFSGSEWEYSVESEEWNSETDSIVNADGGEYPIAQAIQRPYARAVAGSDITQGYDTTAGVFTLSFKPAGVTGGAGVTEVALPPQAFSAYPGAYDTVVTGACIDTTTAPGRILVQPTAGATSVSIKIASKVPPDAG